MEIILSKTAENISLAPDLPNLNSPLHIEQCCTSPDFEKQSSSNMNDLSVESTEDLNLTRNPEETSTQLKDGYLVDAPENSSHKQLFCPECQASFSERNLLWKHLMAHEGASEKYKCLICRRRFFSTLELNRHIRAQNGLKPYKCTKCDQFFSQKNLLDNHMNQHEGRKGHLCDICGECLSSGSNLKAHISNLHSAERKKPFKCSECDKCFARSHHLENHSVIHQKCRPHQCTTCGVTFKRSSQLQEHENVHCEEKQFRCEECNKCFRTKRVLNVHQLVHSDLKPHQCSQCSKSFVRRGGLLAHLRHTSVKFYLILIFLFLLAKPILQ